MFHLARSRMALRIVATLLATSMVAACGYKGPLYMPPPDPTQKSGAQPAAAPQPAQIIPPVPVQL